MLCILFEGLFWEDELSETPVENHKLVFNWVCVKVSVIWIWLFLWIGDPEDPFSATADTDHNCVCL